MDPTAAGFMLADSRNTPMHVGGLHLYEPPDGAGPEYVRQMFGQPFEQDQIAPLFIKRPTRGVTTGGQWMWVEDEEFDIEYHVRDSALPRPGRIRELLELVGRLHGTRLSFERPLWEFHVIEGLDDGRVAAYTKMHHALVDGVSSMRLLQSTLSTDPDTRDMLPPWARKDEAAKAARAQEGRDEAVSKLPVGAVRSALGLASEAAGLPAALVRTLNRGLRNEAAPLSFHSPKTILNKNITGSRRFAAQDWPIDRLRAVGRATGTSLNDVVLAMCGGALRAYLLEQNALPDAPLVAMVPVGLKAKEAAIASSKGGNAIGSIMAKLATDVTDPAERLRGIHLDMLAGKKALAAMTPMQITAMAAIGNTPTVLTPLLRLQGIARPPYNVVISNVPGPRRPLYFNGARMAGMYPVSIPVHGIALNITCTSYVDQLSFGFTGCRRTVPHLQRLLVHSENELAALEKAVGIA